MHQNNAIHSQERNTQGSTKKLPAAKLVSPQKKEKERTCLTVVGTYIDYPWDKAVPTSNLITAKLLFNSIISTPGATFHGRDLKNFYLNTPMDRSEYIRLKFNLIPAEIVDKYNLREYEEDRWIYLRIDLGMYGFPQAGILANKLLAKRSAKAILTCMAPHHHLPCSWRFWHQDRRLETCQTFASGTQEVL
jgi:hypothetical protein